MSSNKQTKRMTKDEVSFKRLATLKEVRGICRDRWGVDWWRCDPETKKARKKWATNTLKPIKVTTTHYKSNQPNSKKARKLKVKGKAEDIPPPPPDTPCPY